MAEACGVRAREPTRQQHPTKHKGRARERGTRARECEKEECKGQKAATGYGEGQRGGERGAKTGAAGNERASEREKRDKERATHTQSHTRYECAVLRRKAKFNEGAGERCVSVSLSLPHAHREHHLLLPMSDARAGELDCLFLGGLAAGRALAGS